MNQLLTLCFAMILGIQSISAFSVNEIANAYYKAIQSNQFKEKSKSLKEMGNFQIKK